MRTGDIVVIRGCSQVWYVKTDAEVIAAREHDASRGIFFDSAGEPLLYSSLGSIRHNSPIVAIVTRLRGIYWPHWSRRPTGLVEGLGTIDGFLRPIMFLRRSVTS